MSENNTQTPAQEKPRRSKEDILEIIIAVFLGGTPRLPASCGACLLLPAMCAVCIPDLLPVSQPTATPAGTRLPRRSCRICRCGT